MSKNKATESALGEMHMMVTKVLTAQVSRQEEEEAFNADGELVASGNMIYTAPPATLAAAIKFLKDNQITTDIEIDNNMSNLRDALSKKQKHSRLSDGKAAALSIVEG